jgi:hypothetical protein
MRGSLSQKEKPALLMLNDRRANVSDFFSFFFLVLPKLSLSPWDRQTDRSVFAQSIGEEARARGRILIYSKLLHQIRLVHIFTSLYENERERETIYPFSIHYQMTASQHSEMKQLRSLCDIYRREKRAKAIKWLNWLNEWMNENIYCIYIRHCTHRYTDGRSANRINLIGFNWLLNR